MKSAIQHILDTKPLLVEKHLKRYVVSDDGCWEWTGPIYPANGGRLQYGVCSFGLNGVSKKVGAHRLSYARAYQKDPGEQFVCHKCDNPLCINPEHLFLGDAFANMRDMHAKGRAAPQDGENNGNAKLDRDAAVEAMKLINRGLSNKKIASRLGVSHSSISLIRLGKAWGKVADEIGFIPTPIFKRKIRSNNGRAQKAA